MTAYQHILEAFYKAEYERKLAKAAGNDIQADMWSAIHGLMEQARKRYESELPE